jgi:hypothetical protein
MSSDTNDPILKILRNCVALSDNMGAAKSWINRANPVPKPDVSLGWLRLLSVLPFGIEHWLARSPLTGLAKMLTFGGLGVWYVWDIAQLWFEPERVVNYGMSMPLDMKFANNIGQGMITDKPSVYKTNASYSLWLFGIIFGFLGIDSLIASNGGQFLRKLVEFFLFALCFSTIVNIWNTGITFGWICAVIFGSFLASIIIAEYISVLSVVLGGNVFSEGIHFTNKQDKQFNGFFSWLIKNTSFSDEQKAQIVKDLQYGGVSAEEIVKMFKIMHPTEVKAEKMQEEEQGETSSSWVSFFLLMASPFLILWNFIMMIVFLIKEGVTSVTPWYPAILAGKIAAIIGLKTAGLEPMAEQLGLGPMMKVMGPVGGLKLDKLGGIANKMVSAGKASDLMGQAKSLVGEKSGDLMGQASSLVGDKVGQASSLIGDKVGQASSLIGDKVGQASSLIGDKVGQASSLIGDKVGQASSLLGDKVGQASSLLGDKVGQATAGVIPKVPLSVPTKVGFTPQRVRQHGGGEALSAESQIFGAVTVALISGGVIKGLVDYLVAE